MNKTVLINRLTLFLIIMNSGGILIIKHLYITILILIIISLNILRQKKYNFTFPVIGMLSITFLLSFNILVTYEQALDKTHIIYFVYFLIAFLYYNIYKNKRYNFINDLEKVLIFFLYQALFSFFMQFLVKNNLSNYFNTGNTKTFMNLVFYPGNKEYFFFFRNQGLFWEPGVLQIYMNILFFITTFIRKNIKISILSVSTILSTYSTTGLLILAIQLLVLLYNLKDISMIKKIYLIPFFVILGTGLWFMMSDNIENKFNGSDAHSSYARMYDFITAVNIIQEHPLNGIGPSEDKYDALRSKFGYSGTELTDEEVQGHGGTNAILKIAYQFGIPIGLLLLLFLYKQQVILVKHELFFIILITSLFSEPLIMSPFVLFFVAAGMENSISIFNQNVFFYRQKN